MARRPTRSLRTRVLHRARAVAAAALRRAPADPRTREVLASISDPFFAVDTRWRLTHLNAEAERVLGTSAERLVGRVLWEAFPDAIGSPFWTEYHRAVRTGRATAFTAFYPPLDTWFDVRAYPFHGGLSVVVQDVNARVATARAVERQRDELERLARDLSAGEERLALALEGSRQGTWDLDVPTGDLHLSDRWWEVLGHRPPRAPHGMATWRALTHPQDRDRLAAAVEAHLAGQARDVECEHRLRAADGSWRWVLARGRVVEHGGGGPARVSGTTIDVHARRTAEDALRQERDRTDALVWALQDGVVVSDADGRILRANPSFCRMVGLPPGEVVGALPPYPWWPPEDVDWLCRAIPYLAEGRSGEWEPVLLRSSGERFPVIVSASPVRPGSAEDGVVITVKDVTERRRAEDRLRESEAGFRLLAENATDMVARHAPDGTMLWVSPAAEHVTGFPAEALTGSAIARFAHPDDLDRLADHLAHLTASEGVSAVTYRFRGPDGGWSWLESTCRGVRDAEGRVRELQSSTRDVTERTREAQERAALATVAEAVARGDDPAALFELVAAEAAQVLGTDDGAIWRFTGPERLELAGAHGRLDGRGRLEAMLPAEGAVAEACRAGRAALVPGRGAGSPHAVAAPVRVGGRLWGVVVASTEHGPPPPPGSEERLGRFAGLVAIAVANAEARVELERRASRDPLTGLPNRRAFTERLELEAARTVRHGRPLAVALLDLDHFKRINDEHGHQAGDRVLKEAAACIEAQARADDLVARLGGEEFAWLMPETPGAAAWAAVERARVALQSLPLPPIGRLTVSAGVAELTGGDDPAAVLALADRALYAAKRGGRNEVVRWMSSGPA